LVEGCLEWQRNGLRPPAAVLAATEAYRLELDKLGMFFDERCRLEPEASTRAAALYNEFTNWCLANGYGAESQRTFGLRLRERGFTKNKDRVGWHWKGIALQPEVLDLV
jgi:putative DNA primase/helicase